MTEQKKPLAGEWWEKDGCRVRIVGHRLDGLAITETIGRFIGSIRDIEGWKHLPECDSFEWKPETFPQFYRGDGWSDYDAYVRFDSPDAIGVAFKADGTSSEFCQFKFAEVPENITRFAWRKITQAEAESRVRKPEPVESPDDWVTQDRVPFRPNLDQRRWVTVTGGVACDWEFVDEITTAQPVVHGALNKCSNRLEIRCRRKHLPPPKPNYVKMWTHRTSGTVCVTTDEKYLAYPEIWTELKHDGTGFYLLKTANEDRINNPVGAQNHENKGFLSNGENESRAPTRLGMDL